MDVFKSNLLAEQNSCGVYHHTVVISCQSTKWPFSQLQSPRANRSVTSVCTWTPTYVNAQTHHAAGLLVLRRFS